jgi:hypothetical protein
LIIGAVYMLRAIRGMLHGPLPNQWATVADAPHLWRKAPFILLLASLLVFGCVPKLLTDKIQPSVSEKVLTATPPKPPPGAGAGKDAYHRAQYLFGEVTDAVERVPTGFRDARRY